MIEDYKPNDDLFSEEDSEITMLKHAVEKLNPADKIIFLMYCEIGSLRKVGKELGVSAGTIFKEIRRIKELIKEWCNNNYPNNNLFK